MSRVLDEYTFSQAVLMIAFCNVSIAVAPSGLNGIALRHDLRSDARLLRLGAIAATITAAVSTTLGVVVYRVRRGFRRVLFAAINAGGIALLAKAAFQRAQQFQKMVALYQIANGVLLIASLLMLAGIGRAVMVSHAAGRMLVRDSQHGGVALDPNPPDQWRATETTHVA